MNRIITAIIEQIQTELTVDVLAEFYVNIFSDVAVGTADADAQFTYALTVVDLRDVGAFWLHPELMALVVPEITGRLLHDMYGKLAIAAATEAGDILAVASAASGYCNEAAAAAITRLTEAYPNLAVNVEKADAAVRTSGLTIEHIMEHLREIVDELDSGEPSPASPDGVHIFTAPATVQ